MGREVSEHDDAIPIGCGGEKGKGAETRNVVFRRKSEVLSSVLTRQVYPGRREGRRGAIRDQRVRADGGQREVCPIAQLLKSGLRTMGVKVLRKLGRISQYRTNLRKRGSKDS